MTGPAAVSAAADVVVLDAPRATTVALVRSAAPDAKLVATFRGRRPARCATRRSAREWPAVSSWFHGTGGGGVPDLRPGVAGHLDRGPGRARA